MAKYNWRKEGIFGSGINDNARDSRLISIGLGLGLIFGTTAPHPFDKFLLVFGVFVVLVRSFAQVRWPDENPPSSKGDRNA